jgi:hypothetical protein
MFKIEKNIPLATKQSYPFDDMEPGDSFFVPVADPKKIGYVRAQINNYKKKHKEMVISTRAEETGLRVWLIKKEQA